MQSELNRPTSRNDRKRHGLGGTSTYRSWYSMIDRCINPANVSFKNYGARGIKVCERWHDITNFVADMGLRPEGMTIDRINGALGYEPGNCRWATELEQQRNRRSVKCSPALAKWVKEGAANGLSQKEMAAMLEMNQSSISRILAGSTWR